MLALLWCTCAEVCNLLSVAQARVKDVMLCGTGVLIYGMDIMLWGVDMRGIVGLD